MQRIASTRKEMEVASAHDSWTKRLRAAEEEEELLLKELEGLRVKEEKLMRNAKVRRVCSLIWMVLCELGNSSRAAYGTRRLSLS